MTPRWCALPWIGQVELESSCALPDRNTVFKNRTLALADQLRSVRDNAIAHAVQSLKMNLFA
jgi:hypothetical protein